MILVVLLCWFTLVIHVLQAEFVPKPDPSLTEQYEYASEHDIKCLVIIRDTGGSHKDSVKVILSWSSLFL